MISTRELADKTLAEVQALCRDGCVSPEQFEAYMHVWATGAPRLSGLEKRWTDPPTDPEVVALVKEMRGVPPTRGRSRDGRAG